MSVNKFVKTPDNESAVEQPGRRPDIFEKSHSARIAVYAVDSSAPKVFEVASANPGVFLEQLTERVSSLSNEQGGAVPRAAIKEIIDNLIHAGLRGVTVSIMERGSVVRVSDLGPGINNQARVRERGFTTANEGVRVLIRGVGSGLPTAESVLEKTGGSLEIESNIGKGTVVTMSMPREKLASTPLPETVFENNLENLSLSKRHKTVFFTIIDLGEAGPSRIASELAVGLSTVYRDLRVLEGLGLTAQGKNGKRIPTEKGLSCVDMVMNA